MMLPEVVGQFALCLKSRKEAIMLYSLLSIVGLFIVSKGLPPPILLFKLFCAMAGTSFGVYLYNDLCDLEEDLMISKIVDLTPASRPLGRGLVSKKMMGIFATLLAALGLTAAALINSRVLLAQIVFLALGFAYSTEPLRLKRVFLGKQVTIAAGGIIACLNAGLAAGNISIQILYMACLYVLFIVGAYSLIDIKDMESDHMGRVKTIPILYGPEATVKMALTTFTAAAATTWIGYYRLGFNIVLPIIGTTLIGAMVYVVYTFLGRLADTEYMLKALIGRVFPLYLLLQIIVLLGSLSF